MQFWTSRGFGRGRRRTTAAAPATAARTASACNGTWGIVDVDDCVNAARYLAERGEVDGERLAIRGGSAGGYTTLCALIFHDDFSGRRQLLRRRRLRGAGATTRTSSSRAIWTG